MDFRPAWSRGGAERRRHEHDEEVSEAGEGLPTDGPCQGPQASAEACIDRQATLCHKVMMMFEAIQGGRASTGLVGFRGIPAVFALLALLSGCSPSPRVSVTNRSPHALTNVVVSGAGFSQRVPVLEPGQRVRWRVEPSGDSGLSLRFDAAGRTIDSGKHGYFEPRSHYRVDAVVQPDLNVTVATRTGLF